MNMDTYIFSARSWDLNPCFGEEGAWSEHEDNVKTRVDGVFDNVR